MFVAKKLNRLLVGALLPLFAGAMLLASCNKEKAKDENFEKVLVINELMASNHTGLLTKNGETCDWLEIKNVSSEDVSLKGYTLEYEKAKVEKDDDADKKKDKKKKDKKKDKAKNDDDKADADGEWTFPDVTLKPGQCVVVFASKDVKLNSAEEIHANFKLSADGGKVQLVSESNTVMSEVTYGALKPDEAYRRLQDGSFEKSHWATPGFDNTNEGYEAYNELLDGQRQCPVQIWRVMSKGDKESGHWAELKNVSAQPVDLSEYCLTDNPGKPDKWKFSAVKLAPGATYKVVFVGKKAPADEADKVNFKIDEEVLILTKGGKFVDGVNASATKIGTSVGRANGRKGFFYFKDADGGEEECAPFRFIAQQPSFMLQPGVYGKKKSMFVGLDGHGCKVHYTVNGSIPSSESKVYKDSVKIESSTTFRAYAEGDSNTLSSDVVTGTYILGQNHDVAVMNITVNESDLYDFHSGIYVDGPSPGDEFPYTGANYWKPWEKRANIEFFDGKEGFSEGCVLKIFGGFSRALPKKSFSVKFNGKFGPSSLTYDYFGKGEPDRLKSFVLRGGGQDAELMMGRDEFLTSLMAQNSPKLLVQDYRPVALYINTKYFGLYFIREKINKDFVSRHMGVSSESVTMFESEYLEGANKKDYTSMVDFLESHNMKAKENFNHAAQLVDFENLIDYKIGEIYATNVDVGNMRYFTSSDPKGDRKWRWIYYDLDASFMDLRNASYYLGLNNDGYVNFHNRVIALLLKSPDFRDLFLQRLSHHMHHTFATTSATKMFDDLIKSIDSEMVLNCKRWEKMLTYDQWKKYVNEFRKTLQTRNKVVLNDIRKYLQVTKEEESKYFSDLGF